MKTCICRFCGREMLYPLTSEIATGICERCREDISEELQFKWWENLDDNQRNTLVEEFVEANGRLS